MKKSLLDEAKKNPLAEILLNQDSSLGESIVMCLSELSDWAIKIGYIDSEDDLLEFDIIDARSGKKSCND